MLQTRLCFRKDIVEPCSLIFMRSWFLVTVKLKNFQNSKIDLNFQRLYIPSATSHELCPFLVCRSQGVPWRKSGQNGAFPLLRLTSSAFSFYSPTRSFRRWTGSKTSCGPDPRSKTSETVCRLSALKRRAGTSFRFCHNNSVMMINLALLHFFYLIKFIWKCHSWNYSQEYIIFKWRICNDHCLLMKSHALKTETCLNITILCIFQEFCLNRIHNCI